jgi:hypothetical protein
MAGVAQRVYDVRADEAGASGDEHSHAARVRARRGCSISVQRAVMGCAGPRT